MGFGVPTLANAQLERAAIRRGLKGVKPTDVGYSEPMTWRVDDAFLASKYGEAHGGDDRLLITDDFVAVLDGVSRFSARNQVVDGGRCAAVDVGLQALRNLPRTASATDAVAALTLAVRKHLLDSDTKDVGCPAENPPSAFVVAIHSRARNEVWRVGDCHVRIDDDTYLGGFALDALLLDVRAYVVRAHLRNGASFASLARDDPSRAVMRPLYGYQASFRNAADERLGFGVIDGKTVPDAFIETISVPVGAESVILATDGYPMPLPTLDATEAFLHDALSSDPLCIGEHRAHRPLQPGAQSYDDRAYVRVTRHPR